MDRIAELAAKEDIRELALLYSRGVDRKDMALLRTLYTAKGLDDHGPFYSGDADGYMTFLAESLPAFPYSGHHVCNHLIALSDGCDEGEGEVYAIAVHVVPDGLGGYMQDIMYVRYLDRYRREADGRWRFARRVVAFDHHEARPIDYDLGARDTAEGLSYASFALPLFAEGGSRTAAEPVALLGARMLS